MNDNMERIMRLVKHDDFDEIEPAPDDEDTEIARLTKSDVKFEDAPTDVEGFYSIEELVDLDAIGIKAPVPPIPTVGGGDGKEDDATVAYNITLNLVHSFDFRNDESGLYVYNEVIGRYETLNKTGDFKGSIAYFVTNNATAYQDRLKTSVFNMVYSHLRNTKRWSKPMPVTDHMKVCLRNVVFDLEDGSVLKHNKRFGFKASIGAYYESHAKLAPVSIKYFTQLGGGKTGAKLILAALGIILSNYRKLGKAIFLYGPRSNGKSTLAQLIRQLLPEKAVRGLSMTDFGNQFAIANLKNAHVTICTDLPAGSWSKTAIGKFKQTVTGDFFEAGAKGVQQDTIKPHAFVVFISNFLPKIPASQDPENAVQRRIWPIKTGESVPPEKVDPDLLDKLLDDRDAIVSIALQEASWLLNLEKAELKAITSAGKEIYEFAPTTIEECMADFLTTLTLTDNETDEIRVSTLFEQFKLRYEGCCVAIKTMKANGFGVHLRKGIQSVGGSVKKLHNVSTLIGFKMAENANDIN